MTRQRLIRALLLAILGSVLVYAVLAALTDAQAVASALRDFPLDTLAVMLILTLFGYFMRAVRWRYLTGLVSCPLTFRDAVYIQFSGMTMTVTPGKVGEVLKAYLAQEVCGLRMSRGIAVVFCERLADLFAILVLSVGGVSLLGGGWFGLAIAAVVVVLGTLTASSPRFHEFALHFIESRKWAQRHHASASAISDTTRTVLTPLPLAISVGLAMLSWGAEGIAFALALRALDFTTLGVIPAVAVYAMSTVIGALVFLPGGIGLTEASMAGLLIAAGMPGPDATAATVLIRLVTMWFGVGLGWLVFASRPTLLRGFLGTPDVSA